MSYLINAVLNARRKPRFVLAIMLLITGLAGSNTVAIANNDTNCACDGKLTTLMLQYLGDPSNHVTVIQKNGETIHQASIAATQVFALTGTDQRGKKLSNTTFGPWIDINLADGSHTRIHTSCSIEIKVGDIIGDFRVMAGTSRNNGAICGMIEVIPGG